MRYFLRSQIFTGIAALTLAAGPAQAQDPYPTLPSGAPPVNIGVEGMEELLAGHVYVTRLSAPEPGRQGGVKLRIFYTTHDYRIYECSFDPTGHYGTTPEPRLQWPSAFYDPRLDLRIPVVSHQSAPDTWPTVAAPYHDPLTGLTIMFMRGIIGTWYPRETGHLQARLPASTWDLCPDFPSAKELGVGINKKQTALTYDKLLEQDPGRRILRPDLINFNALVAGP